MGAKTKIVCCEIDSKMKLLFTALCVAGVLSLALVQNAFAGTYELGAQAYSSKNYQKAIEIWSQDELRANPDAQFGLGVLYIRGMGIQQNMEKGVEFYKRAARLGHASAQFNLGLAYFTERGVKYSPGKAKLWWEKAAIQGHAGAQYNLAAILWSGKGVGKDQASAMHWFRKAVHNGSVPAISFLRKLYQPMQQVLVENIKEINNRETSRSIPLIEEMGMYKLAKQAMQEGSHDQAFKYWQPLAKDGHAESQYQVAVLYEQGLGVDQNLEEAIDWYRSAAEKGEPNAQFRIGLYHINESDDANPSLGLYWIQSAADNDNLQAKEYLQQNL